MTAFHLRDHLRNYVGLTGGECLFRVIALKPETILDVGSGAGQHAKLFREQKIKTTTISLSAPADYVGDFMEYRGDPVECIWACHILEHIPNINLFLRKCREHLHDHGFLAITVPPLKTELVDGHVNLFTMGTLCYTLIIAGFKPERIGSYGYNLSAICKKIDVPSSTDLPEIEHYFPGGSCNVLDDFDW